MKVIIIGGVAGGASAAARLRRLDEKVDIVLFEKGEHFSYANCGLPYYIGGEIKERNKLFVQTEDGLKKRFNIDTRIQTEVVDINRKEKTITAINLKTKQQYTEQYDKLIISTGAKPFVPNIEGIDDKRIFTLRNVADADAIKNFVEKNHPKNIAIVGGGFIGLEMAENLKTSQTEIFIVEATEQVMAPLDFSMAAIVHHHLMEKKVNLLLSEAVTKFEPKPNELVIHFKSGKTLVCDMVIWSVGVKPENDLAIKAQLDIGIGGGIVTNEYMQTSDKDIYAIGDVVEVFNPIINQKNIIPLAGPANKQGRLVADNILFNNTRKYSGTIGTAIAKVFDLTVASAGASAKLLKRNNIEYKSSYTHSASHASYYPDAAMMGIKIIFSPTDGKLLGAQIVGKEGVESRINMFSQIIKSGKTIFDLQEIEHVYAPPYSSAKDPVNMAGYVAENILNNVVKTISWREVMQHKEKYFLVDVRTAEEFNTKTIDNAINIPVDELRNRKNELPTDKTIVLFCAVGLRGYLAYRILSQSGFTNIFNLSGGFRTYDFAATPVHNKI